MEICFVNLRHHVFNSSIAALSASLKQAGYEPYSIRVYDDADLPPFLEHVAVAKPPLLLFSVMSVTWPLAKKIIEKVREIYRPTIVCGGYHPTLFPEEVIAHEGVDALCIGEGDHSLVQFVKAIAAGGTGEATPNFWVKTKANGTLSITKNEIAPLVSDLDSLPLWDRGIFSPYGSIAETGEPTVEQLCPGYVPKGLRRVLLYQSRGCYYNCSYCCNKSIRTLYKGKGTMVRHRSIDRIVEELRLLKEKYDPEYFEFLDEMFPIEPDWLAEFCRRYTSEIGVPFGISYTIRNAEDGVLRALSTAGCTLIYFGLECGDEEYRSRYLHKHVKNKDVVHVFRFARELGITRVATNMIRLPFETRDLVNRTIALNQEIQPDLPCFFTFQPLVGTDLHRLCVENNLISSEGTWMIHHRKSNLKSDLPDTFMDEKWKEIETLRAQCIASRAAFPKRRS